MNYKTKASIRKLSVSRCCRAMSGWRRVLLFGERIRRARSSVQIDKREFVVFPDHRLGNKNMQGCAAKIYQGNVKHRRNVFPLVPARRHFRPSRLLENCVETYFLIYITTRTLPVRKFNIRIYELLRIRRHCFYAHYSLSPCYVPCSFSDALRPEFYQDAH